MILGKQIIHLRGNFRRDTQLHSSMHQWLASKSLHDASNHATHCHLKCALPDSKTHRCNKSRKFQRCKGGGSAWSILQYCLIQCWWHLYIFHVQTMYLHCIFWLIKSNRSLQESSLSLSWAKFPAGFDGIYGEKKMVKTQRSDKICQVSPHQKVKNLQEALRCNH